MADALPESTVELLERVRAGDSAARHSRVWLDTQDPVQETVIRTLKTTGRFEYGGSALPAFPRQAAGNGIPERHE
jgi:hypothetical protein